MDFDNIGRNELIGRIQLAGKISTWLPTSPADIFFLYLPAQSSNDAHIDEMIVSLRAIGMYEGDSIIICTTIL